MARRNRKPGYRYGLIVNQEKYPVIVHRPGNTEVTYPGGRRTTWLTAACGAGLHQGGRDNDDRRSYVEIQTRLLDADATVYCKRCWGEEP